VPLDEIDFEERHWVPHSGWPFNKSHLDPFYERALRIGGAGPFAYDVQSRRSTHPELLTLSARVRTMMTQFGARKVFTHDLPQELARHKQVDIFLNATLLELILDRNVAQRARIAAAPNWEFHISARIFVLAAGAIENARILLLSNGTQQKGLGNQHDLVGRFFMDHPSIRLGLFTPADRNLFRSTGLYDHHFVRGVPVMAKLTIREEVMRQEKMLNLGVALAPRSRGYESQAVKILKRMFKSTSPRMAAGLFRKEFRTLMTGWDEILVRSLERLTNKRPIYCEHQGGWSRLSHAQHRFRKFEMRCLTEQAPNPENRITLGHALDYFGQRKVQLHWRWSDLDLHSIRRAQEIFREEFTSHGLGTFETQWELDEGQPPLFLSPHHHMGTTRMHPNEKQGVVDASCRLHGVSNLYLAGSSVFPTGGYANPTLTIIALAVRLSYHLKELMKPPLSSLSAADTTRTAPAHDSD
jgi:choline dehydrogenase-like flavoprotein